MSGKNCIVKNKNCIVFPESLYVNLYPAYIIAHDENVMSSLTIHSVIIWSVEWTIKAVFYWQIYLYELSVFYLQTIDRTLCFGTKKSSVLKNSIKFIKEKKKMQPTRWRFFSSPAFLERRVFLFFGHTEKNSKAVNKYVLNFDWCQHIKSSKLT